MTKFNIEIVSDTVCPWCYVGKKKLEKAIAAWNEKESGDTFSITWMPFFLNPDSPKVGMYYFFFISDFIHFCTLSLFSFLSTFSTFFLIGSNVFQDLSYINWEDVLLVLS